MQNTYDITVGIVLYNTKIEDLDKVINSILLCKKNIHIYLLDNSPENSLEKYSKKLKNSKITYIFNNGNGGYGWGHNKALKLIEKKSKYHLIINPDVYFGECVLEELFDYMENNTNIGQIMPMVKYPNGEIQYLCKRFPEPKDLFLRRFCPFKSIVEKNDYYYEMRDTGYNKIMEVPLLSGCFMFIRTEKLIEVKGFDERFFMYLEDYDLTRRIGQVSKIVFYPKVEIVHNHAKESHKSKRMMWEHVKSAVKYFNKWGWRRKN